MPGRADSGSALVTELRDGWAALAAGFMGFALSGMYLMIYTFGLFIAPLTKEFAWSTGQISVALTISGLLTALFSPVAGYAADRWGEWLMAPLSIAASAVCFAAFSRLGPDIHLFWLGYAILGVILAGSSTLVFSRVVSAQFARTRGLALGFSFLGSGLCAVLAPLITNWAITHHGWRSAYMLLAAIAAISTLPIGALLATARRKSPVSPAPATHGGAAVVPPIGPHLRTRAFWCLALACLCLTVALTGLIPQFIPLVTQRGISVEEAAIYASILGGAIAGGRLLGGFLADRIFAPYVAAAFVAGGAFGVLLLACGVHMGLGVIATAIGLAFGAEIDLAGYITSRYFGVAAFGRIFGLLYVFIVVGSSGSHLMYGFIFDWSGSYDASLWFAFVCLLAAATIFVTLPRFDDELAARGVR